MVTPVTGTKACAPPASEPRDLFWSELVYSPEGWSVVPRTSELQDSHGVAAMRFSGAWNRRLVLTEESTTAEEIERREELPLAEADHIRVLESGRQQGMPEFGSMPFLEGLPFSGCQGLYPAVN